MAIGAAEKLRARSPVPKLRKRLGCGLHDERVNMEPKVAVRVEADEVFFSMTYRVVDRDTMVERCGERCAIERLVVPGLLERTHVREEAVALVEKPRRPTLGEVTEVAFRRWLGVSGASDLTTELTGHVGRWLDGRTQELERIVRRFIEGARDPRKPDLAGTMCRPANPFDRGRGQRDLLCMPVQ